MYINDAEFAGTTRFSSYSEVYVISGLIILRDDLYMGVVDMASHTTHRVKKLFMSWRLFEKDAVGQLKVRLLLENCFCSRVASIQYFAVLEFAVVMCQD